MKTRIALFLALTLAAWAGPTYHEMVASPGVSEPLAAAGLNGDAADAARLRWAERVGDALPVASSALTLAAAVACFGGPVRRAVAKMSSDGVRVTPAVVALALLPTMMVASG